MPPKSKKFWQFKNKQDDPNVGELLLYGDISSHSWWGDEITPKQFKEDLAALGDISELNIYINSGGGDVFAGQAIHSILKRHAATKTVYIDGLAASIASVIAMAGDRILMPRNAMMMVHKCWTWTSGNADDMRRMADDMDKIDESIIAAYEDKTGMDKDEIKELMEKETWMTAEEAVEYGFADEIENGKKIAAALQDGTLIVNGQEVDVSRFTNIPQFPAAKPVKGEGKTLSAANEQRISQARDLLNDVLEQATSENKTKAQEESLEPVEKSPEPPRQVPVDLYQKLNLINRRKANV
ncbi:MAG: head maturation protease, ClpP-related [Bacillota bacterium]